MFFLFFSVSFAWMCQIMFIGDIEEIHHLYCFTIYTLSDLVNLALLSPLKFYINVLWNKKSWVLKNKMSAYLFYVATLKLFICFTSNDNTKDTKTYYSFFFINLCDLSILHILYDPAICLSTWHFILLL